MVFPRPISSARITLLHLKEDRGKTRFQTTPVSTNPNELSPAMSSPAPGVSQPVQAIQLVVSQLQVVVSYE